MSHKKRILTLDEYTNGHVAALQFMRRQGWNESECELVFCESHALLLERVREGSSFAVLPIKNSSVGDIEEVSGPLVEILESQHVKQIDELSLEVQHHLIVTPSIDSIDEIRFALSHPKAFEQCRGFLDLYGIPRFCCLKFPSTTAGVRFLVGLGMYAVKIAAIGTKEAAEAYDLKILKEGIQDFPDNKTTFVLIQS